MSDSTTTGSLQEHKECGTAALDTVSGRWLGPMIKLPRSLKGPAEAVRVPVGTGI